jgi:hypothetical protein
MLRPIGTGPTPLPVQPALAEADGPSATLDALERELVSPETKEKVKKEAKGFKDDAGSILDNVAAAAKITNGVGQALRLRNNLRSSGIQLGSAAADTADRLAGKADRRINMLMETDKAIADKVKDIVGVQKAPVGMRGSLADRGLVKTAANGDVKKTMRASRQIKQGKVARVLKNAPGVRQLRSATTAASDAIADSTIASKRRAFAEKAATKLGRHADDFGKLAAESGKLAPKLAGQAAKLGATAALKGAGRFAPGVNVAIAGVDCYSAWKTLNDPEASPWK